MSKFAESFAGAGLLALTALQPLPAEAGPRDQPHRAQPSPQSTEPLFGEPQLPEKITTYLHQGRTLVCTKDEHLAEVIYLLTLTKAGKTTNKDDKIARRTLEEFAGALDRQWSEAIHDIKVMDLAQSLIGANLNSESLVHRMHKGQIEALGTLNVNVADVNVTAAKDDSCRPYI